MNKQIDDMARVMCGVSKSCDLCALQSPCLMRNCAHLLYAEGYRKASDVAREIFAEIESNMIFVKDHTGNLASVVRFTDILELKKKYEGEGAE